MVRRVTAARRLAYRAAQLLAGGAGEMHASLAKLYACRMAEHVTRDAVQLHGGMGYAEETSVSRYFVDARVLHVRDAGGACATSRRAGSGCGSRAHQTA